MRVPPAVVLYVMLVGAGCSSVGSVTSVPPGTFPPESPATSSAPTAATALASPTLTARPSPIDDDFSRLIARVAGTPSAPGGELDEMWRAILAENHVTGGLPYAPPAKLVPYYSGEIPSTACAADLPATFWDRNAFYCPADAAILYDETWLRDFAMQTGAYAPAAIVAHEWGHHIQSLLGISGYSIQNELQADCMAGLFLANTENVLPNVPPSDDALTAALTAFFAIGNRHYSSTHWFGDREHGSSQQRIRAFGTGYLASFLTAGYAPPIGRGFAPCYGYQDFKVADLAEIGGYRLINLPGRAERTVNAAYLVDAERRLGYSTSAVILDWLPGATMSDVAVLRDERYPGLAAGGKDLPQIDLGGNVAPGSGTATYAQQRSERIPGGVRSGMLAFIEPSTGGGALLIFVYRPEPPLVEPVDEIEQRVLAEEISTLYEVVGRLCTPDDSGDVSDPNFKPVCLDDQ